MTHKGDPAQKNTNENPAIADQLIVDAPVTFLLALQSDVCSAQTLPAAAKIR
jgi:hypothetical protein